MKKNHWLRTLLVLSLAQAGQSYAGTFHTIIGPDGRPMVVQRPDLPVKKKEVTTSVKPTIQATETKAKVVQPVYISPQVEAQVQDVARELQQQTASDIVKQEMSQKNKQRQEEKSIQQQMTAQDSVSIVPVLAAGKISKNSQQNVESSVKTKTPVKNKEESVETVSAPKNKSEIEQKKDIQASILNTEKPKNLLPKPEFSAPPMPEIIPDKQHAALTTIDGESYVTNEYLENKEFNLDGKKRFYAMPEGVIDPKMGATRIQIVEREKGVGESVLQSLFKRNTQEKPKPVVLSTSYYRVSQQDAIEGLGQQCFVEKKLKKAKLLEPKEDINLWPRAPITEQFDFEVVKVEESIKNIEIHSYASKQNNPVFYWPFAVFLDAKGCVLEGAGGYKNNDSDSTRLYREKIEGVVQVPKGTAFMMLTPLASAIDVDNRVLSNQGQLKLIAIR